MAIKCKNAIEFIHRETVTQPFRYAVLTKLKLKRVVCLNDDVSHSFSCSSRGSGVVVVVSVYPGHLISNIYCTFASNRRMKMFSILCTSN